MIHNSGVRVAGFGFGVPGFGFEIPGSGFRESGFGFQVLGLRCRVLEELRLSKARVSDQEAVRLPPRPRPCLHRDFRPFGMISGHSPRYQAVRDRLRVGCSGEVSRGENML